MSNKSLTTSVSGGIDGEEYQEVSVELELEMKSEVSGHELAEIIMEAVEADDRISIDFACTTTNRSDS